MADINYNIVYKPSHHRAHSNGVVYEHILVAETVLGRKLEDGEVVHHEDENKKNNISSNLIVFKTSADHARFHKTGSREKLIDGTYVSPKYQYTCKNCNKIFESEHKDAINCSLDCRFEGQKKVKIRPDKSELHDLLIQHNFVKVGSMFDVSDNAIRKWCKEYGLSVNSRDYKRV